MRTLFAFCASLMFSSPGIAANITARQNGDWTSALTWDLNRPPANNDIVFIPVGITVKIIASPYPKNNPAARPTLSLNILGTLDFSDPGNDKFYLDMGSVIQVYAGGKILTTNNNPEIIAIYNGSFDNTVWSGDPNIIAGPAIANANSFGFLNMILAGDRELAATSNVRQVDYDTNYTSSLFYNSYKHQLYFNLNRSFRNQQISVCIFNVNGLPVFRNKLVSTSQVVALPSVTPGIYIVQLKGDRGFALSRQILIGK